MGCSEDCQVKVFFSNGHPSANEAAQAGWHATGVVREFPGKKHAEVTAPSIPLHLRGYGKQDETMYLAIQANDQALNTGETVNIFTVPRVPGVGRIQERVSTKLVKEKIHRDTSA